jgi:hypothetical protein
MAKLVDQPNVRKLLNSSAKENTGYQNDEFGVKIFDNSITSPLHQLKYKKKTLSEAIDEAEVRKAKNVMTVTLHQKNLDSKQPIA